MQIYSETIEIAGHVITVSELTTGGVRALLKSVTATINDGNFDVVDFELFPGVDLISVARMVGNATLDDLTPSQLEKVIEKCRLVNPHFFAMRDRLLAAGRQMQERSATPLSERSLS
ncbi:MAG: hypothetical protein HQL73_07300 [Magnetococcales bacterium]|nr:hypothetical protein [Magnetococcales bacterium]